MEIRPEDQEVQNMEQLGVIKENLPVQDHFLLLTRIMNLHLISIKGWQRKSYEIFYQFKREGETAGFKTWLDKNGHINGKWQEIPSLSNSKALSKEIRQLMDHLPEVRVIRDTVETVLDKITFDVEQEEKYPFTRILFDDLENLLDNSGIYIRDVEHLQFRERYTFCRDQEEGIIDFEYNSSGFFSRVVPQLTSSNSKNLLTDLTDRISELRRLLDP